MGRTYSNHTERNRNIHVTVKEKALFLYIYRTLPQLPSKYLVWDIIPMPCDHVEWRKILRCGKELATVLLYYCVSRMVGLLKPCRGGKEIPW